MADKELKIENLKHLLKTKDLSFFEEFARNKREHKYKEWIKRLE